MGFIMNAIQALKQSFRKHSFPREKMQVSKRQTRYNYQLGPMFFLGQQIVKHMQDAGHPACIHCCLRTAAEQDAVFARGASKARAFRSPHQYYEAVDIIHPSLHWGASKEYWKTLADCSRLVSERYGVELELGHDWGWDSAHIEIKDWRKVRDRLGRTSPNQQQLNERFEELMPSVWKQFRRSKAGQMLS